MATTDDGAVNVESVVEVRAGAQQVVQLALAARVSRSAGQEAWSRQVVRWVAAVAAVLFALTLALALVGWLLEWLLE